MASYASLRLQPKPANPKTQGPLVYPQPICPPDHFQHHSYFFMARDEACYRTPSPTVISADLVRWARGVHSAHTRPAVETKKRHRHIHQPIHSFFVFVFGVRRKKASTYILVQPRTVENHLTCRARPWKHREWILSGLKQCNRA